MTDPIQTIGVIGGGQLGRMFAVDAKRMGYDVLTLDPQERSPAGQVADQQIVARYDDLGAIEELGRRSDIVTYEFENVAISSVEHLENSGHKVSPSSSVLRITQDRMLEKRFVRSCGIGTTAFESVDAAADLQSAIATVGFPAILKTVRGGYDGKGQWRVENLTQAEAAVTEAKGAPLIFERVVPFRCEVSVVATRDEHDNVVAYPVGENQHRHGILSMTIAPARIGAAIAARAQEMAATIGRGLNLVGTFCVEFFLTEDGKLLVNEIAPRPHNSGHYTIDVTQCSQYEQHVRAICDLPLSPPILLSNAIMMNILGDGNGDRLGGVTDLLSDPTIVLHMYGKRHAVAGRKMGHFTMLVDGPLDDTAIGKARASHAKLRWTN
ncbi:MAG TPA: 5-(carboxyamino)imidazole ribonucleotide synthase [Candidatus Tumulicola sp.]